MEKKLLETTYLKSDKTVITWVC